MVRCLCNYVVGIGEIVEVFLEVTYRPLLNWRLGCCECILYMLVQIKVNGCRL
jgi:hypothetical protein